MSSGRAFLRRVFIDEEARLRVGWRLVLHTLVMLLGYAIGWAWMWATPGPWSFVTGVMVQTMWVVLATWLFARKVDRRTPASRGFESKHMLVDSLAGAALGCVLIGSVGLIEGRLHWASYVPVVLSREGVLSLVRAVLLFVCVAISEETWFRGYQLTNIVRRVQSGASSARTRSRSS